MSGNLQNPDIQRDYLTFFYHRKLAYSSSLSLDYPLSQFKGKKVLVVNTASKCCFTPQYEGLQELYEKYGDDDFVIIGFPANNFLKQEPGSNEEMPHSAVKIIGLLSQ